MSKDKHHDKKHQGQEKFKEHEKQAKDTFKGQETQEFPPQIFPGLMPRQGDSDGEECILIFTCVDCDSEEAFTGPGPEDEPLCPECGRPMQAQSGGDGGTEKAWNKASAGEWGGKGGFSGESGANIFTCPECTSEKSFPVLEAGEPPQCPICAIPMKAKYVEAD
jgi:hypothetical protein